MTHSGRPPVSSGWITRFGLLYLGQNIAWSGPAQILIATQVAGWFPDDKESRLAWLMGIGGLVSLVASPLAGLLSDRTRSRWGRRAPWILAGGLLAAAALVVAGHAGSYLVLLLAWAAFQFVLALAINAAQAVPPDQVPSQQYGLVSGVMGLAYTLAVVVGTALASLLALRTAYLATAGLLVALTVLFLAGFDGRREGPLPSSALSASGGRPRLPGRRERPDYWWVFLARLVVTLANAIALFYLLYYLRDHIGYADPDTGVLALTAVYAGVVVLTTVLGGRWSDRVGRRVPFVMVTSMGLAVAALIMAWAGTFGVVIVAAAVLGASWGVYMAVDQALINEVLTSAADRGRDMGIMNVAVAVPNTAAPVVAAFALHWLGGYPGLYLVAATLAVIGGLMIRKVRSVA